MSSGLSEVLLLVKYRRDAKEMVRDVVIKCATYHVAAPSSSPIKLLSCLKVARKFRLESELLASNMPAFICI